MKPGRPLKRTSELKRTGQLKPNGRGPARTTELRPGNKKFKQTQRRVKRAIDKHQREAWAQAARTKPCAVCGAKGPRHGHHILYRQWLRGVAESAEDLERLLWDRRNLLTLCHRHHAALHGGHRVVSLVVLRERAPKVFQMARELGLEWRIDRHYGEEV